MNRYDRVVKLWRSWKIETASDLEKYLHSFRVLFAYHSGKIENEEVTWHDIREIFENGRVGRTLLNYYLMTRDHPPLIVGEEDRREYFAALQKYDEDEDLEQLYQFLKIAAEKHGPGQPPWQTGKSRKKKG